MILQKGGMDMTQEQYMRNLSVPEGTVDVVLDTDAYNEIDDQFAISYLVLKPKRFRVLGICAAPFFNEKSDSPMDGMEKSYEEIRRLLPLTGRTDLSDCVIRGSGQYLPDEETPVVSDAAQFMAALSRKYDADHPLYIIAIGAITNVASALLMEPEMKERCVVVWLGGRAVHMPQGGLEFNLKQDVAAARVVLGSGVPMVQLPCRGVVDRFHTTRYELEHWLHGRNALCDYLCDCTIRYMKEKASRKSWSKPIWDVTAVAWLLNTDERFMHSRLIPAPIPEYDLTYRFDETRHLICYIDWIDRDALFEDLFTVLAEKREALLL